MTSNIQHFAQYTCKIPCKNCCCQKWRQKEKDIFIVFFLKSSTVFSNFLYCFVKILKFKLFIKSLVSPHFWKKYIDWIYTHLFSGPLCGSIHVIITLQWNTNIECYICFWVFSLCFEKYKNWNLYLFLRHCGEI